MSNPKIISYSVANITLNQAKEEWHADCYVILKKKEVIFPHYYSNIAIYLEISSQRLGKEDCLSIGKISKLLNRHGFIGEENKLYETS